MQLRIKDWNKFQHFKDRNPPWVKLYKELLDDPDWHDLDPLSAKVLVMLWLIASEDTTKSGLLPDTRKLSFRLRMSENDVKNHCIKLSHWVIQGDIKVISEQYQLDAPETETKAERETKTEKPIATGKPDCPHQEIIALYHEILPVCPAIRDWTPARASALKARWNEDKERQNLDYWKNLFGYIAGIPFLTGKVASSGRKPFVLSLDWLVKADNFAKVREGRYEGNAE